MQDGWFITLTVIYCDCHTNKHFRLSYEMNHRTRTAVSVLWIWMSGWTYFSILDISFTASTPPGRGSSSMKKCLDSQILMAFSCSQCKLWLLSFNIRDVTVWTFLIMIIVTKMITVISIITVLLNYAGNVQKVFK